MPSLADLIRRIGYDPKVGPLGSLTVDTGRDNPLTVPGMPGLPGVVLKGSQPLTPEDQAHEGFHVGVGLPGSILGTLAGKVAGVGSTAGYMQPDEVLAYMAQPTGPVSANDARTIMSLAKGGEGSQAYRDFVIEMARRKAAQTPSLADLIAGAR